MVFVEISKETLNDTEIVKFKEQSGERALSKKQVELSIERLLTQIANLEKQKAEFEKLLKEFK